MKLTLLVLLVLAGCSSSQTRNDSSAPAVKNEAFKKTKPLTSAQVPDFYEDKSKSLNPALQDETMDRYSKAELKEINTSSDPLMDISVKCSQGDFKGAFALASQHYNLYQKVAPYWNLVGNCHLNQGAHRKALLFYNKALEVNPNYVPALNNIGVMYSRQGLDQKALVAFERANKASKFSKTPRYNLGKVYLTYGLTDLALPLLKSLSDESPTDVDLLNAVANCYFITGNYQEAMSYYQRIPQSQWSQAEIGLNLAFTLKKLGKNKEAGQVFDRVEKPSSNSLKKYYSSIESQLGDA